ncbi:hypothetical protein [Escherichia phage FL04]|uniref:Uncharacterized protein n=1 Tax=Escherichia phage kaaroe TaxID=2696412 RepID=A0A6B9WR04_9CAUD|nr:hypothetical protein kaaroe_252 [Escherichia phage kaaroe]
MITPQLHGKEICDLTWEELVMYRDTYKWFESMKEFVAAVREEMSIRQYADAYIEKVSTL